MLLQLLDRFTHNAPLPDPLPLDPFPLFKAWYDEAGRAKQQPNPNAVYLATATPEGRPSVRAVLCRGIREADGSVEFFTNRSSRKGRELAANPRAALLFHWDHPDRQVRVEGPVTLTSDAESDAYFNSRRWESRLGAWASDQSEPIASRRALLDKVSAVVNKHGIDVAKLIAGVDVHIPRPPYWGGFRVWADRVELWQGGVGRVHDRAAWTREVVVSGGSVSSGPWTGTRLQP
ncbi:MAG: pyridoxamine 5'-phosphate oxidase [Phycisphaeraceae bacterium]|nr:MAG: pyridoxamine 5'-phosphate oxidase [Phycisphaeraceae bacterium]